MPSYIVVLKLDEGLIASSAGETKFVLLRDCDYKQIGSFFVSQQLRAGEEFAIVSEPTDCAPAEFSVVLDPPAEAGTIISIVSAEKQ